MTTIGLLIGVLGAVGLLVTIKAKSDKEKHILSIGLAVAALIYVGFALIGNADLAWIVTEVSGVGIFGLFAVLGLHHSRWWLVLGWLTHPIWDVWLHFIGSGAMFTPTWYSSACISFDLLVAAYIFYAQVRANSLSSDDASRITIPMHRNKVK
jgi:hypothetical protein